MVSISPKYSTIKFKLSDFGLTILGLVKPHFFSSNLLTQKRNLPYCSFKSNQRPAKSSIMTPRVHFDSAVSFTPRSLPPRLTPRSLNKYKFLGEIETEFENICRSLCSNISFEPRYARRKKTVLNQWKTFHRCKFYPHLRAGGLIPKSIL